MHEPLALVALAVAVVGYALVSRRLSTTPVSGPIVFVAAACCSGRPAWTSSDPTKTES